MSTQATDGCGLVPWERQAFGPAKEDVEDGVDTLLEFIGSLLPAQPSRLSPLRGLRLLLPGSLSRFGRVCQLCSADGLAPSHTLTR